ncbi:hypothetical protein QBC39DRAFT_374888 [Podospora conica]|nr:hypothetical protein QBC39DRAFT_374888 [Schizothecium conicum]
MLVQVSTAAFIPFDNCLPESYKNNVPVPLQWVPLFVDATFNLTDPKHTLTVTMWGNVTGAFFNVTLPPADSPDWADPTKTDGKIIDEPDPGVPKPMLTTLHSRINFLTYIPWTDNFNFCNNSLHNATCPLAPVFDGNSSRFSTEPYGLPYVSMTNDMESTYAFGSLSATFLVIYGDSRGTNIGCVSATITPDIGNLAWMIKFLPLVILLLVGGATLLASIFSPWGTSDLFHWTSNYGRDPDLLRLVTPGFGDCLQYIQFIALTGALTLSYPGFYQPIVSQASWSALMFNHSFVAQAPGYDSIHDGIYVLNGNYGLQRFAQLVGMGEVEDIWAGMMIYLLIIIASMVVLVQSGFLAQWIYRAVKKVPEEDLRNKNIPFTLGNMVRIVLNYFLFPIVALSTFQLVVAGQSPAFTVGLAVVTLILIVGFAAWLLYLIVTTKPRAFLFDDLYTVLLYGPLYNTYSDESTAFALVPVVLSFVRGIAVGAVQPAGVAQVVILAICEIVQILTLHAFRPFHSPTSMNAYHTLFSAFRLITVLLMVAFIPSLAVTEGPKGWIGYVILCIHGIVLLLVFFLNAIQTVVEVAARMAGAGGDDELGALSRIFGMRQLSRRRVARRENGASRQSQLSSSAMLDSDVASKAGFMGPEGRLRSESAASMGIVMQRRERSLSALDQMPIDPYAPSAFTPTTPGEASTFSFLPSPGIQVRTQGGLNAQPLEGFYRPPRRRQTVDAAGSPGPSIAKGDSPQKRRSQLAALQLPGPSEMDGQSVRGEPYTPSAALLTPRTDYSTREVDFYYNPRGQKLNAEAHRNLRTGPADPTGPMSAAAGWFRNMVGAKSKGKTKGFEVVRSARMQPPRPAPPPMDEDEAPPAGIPVAMGVLRNGPIESDDEDDMRRTKKDRGTKAANAPLLNSEDGGSRRGRDLSSDRDDGHGRASSTGWEQPGSSSMPYVPRRSSKRASLTLSPGGGSSRLPFERTPSQRRLSGTSSMGATDFSQMDSHEGSTGAGNEAYGFVHQGSVRQVEHSADYVGRSAEVVDERR